MFKVGNADFIADKLAAELLPDQEYREVYINGIEAIGRRQQADGSSDGRIELDVDWSMLHGEDGALNWFISCADDGDGMTRHEIERYTTTLAVEGAGKSQSLTKNQGMGLKISGPTRNHQGVLIRSLKNGEAWAVQIGWTGSEYDLIPIGDGGATMAQVTTETFPEFIRNRGSGTVVTFLGMKKGDNTFRPLRKSKGWLFKYLNQRLLRASDNGVDVFVRVPSRDESEWPTTREEAGELKSFNLQRVKGTGNIWDDVASRDGGENVGSVDLAGIPEDNIPAARIHWWVMPNDDASTRTAGPGSLAVLYQNELHDWKVGAHANQVFARLGVIYAKNRIGFVVEPLGSTVSSDFARAHVLVGGTPVFESEAWNVWSEQFRENMPERIEEANREEANRLSEDDPDRARRIEGRLKDIYNLLKPRRFRRDPEGSSSGTGDVTGPGSDQGATVLVPIGTGKRNKSKGPRGIGSVLEQAVADEGEAATEVYSFITLDVKWVTEKEAEGKTLVAGASGGLEDRAAALVGEDAASATTLFINSDFRGYQTILAAVNEFANPEGDEFKAQAIDDVTREWVQQKLIETVTGLRQLENSSTWLASSFDEALSPAALTAAFMADRYHTLQEVKRAAGKLKAAPTAA